MAPRNQSGVRLAQEYIKSGLRVPYLQNARLVNKCPQETQQVVIIGTTTPSILNAMISMIVYVVMFLAQMQGAAASNGAQKGALVNVRNEVMVKNFSTYRMYVLCEWWTTRRSPPAVGVGGSLAGILPHGLAAPWTSTAPTTPSQLNEFDVGFRLQQNREWNLYFRRYGYKRVYLEAAQSCLFTQKQFTRKPGYLDYAIHSTASGTVGANVLAFSGEGGMASRFMTMIVYGEPEVVSTVPSPWEINYSPAVYGMTTMLKADLYWAQYNTTNYAVGYSQNADATQMEEVNWNLSTVFPGVSSAPLALASGV